MVGRGALAPLPFGGAALCWGRSVTTQTHLSVGIPQVRWVHLARQYIALPRPWLPLRMESSVSRDLRSPVTQMWGSFGSSPLAYVSRPGLCRGGGVVGREEGVGAVHHPVVSWCVVVGGGEGVVQIVHESHVRGGGWLTVVGGGDVPRAVVQEVAQGGHPGYPCFPLAHFGVVRGGAGWGLGHVGLAVAMRPWVLSRCGTGCPTRCRPQSMGGTQIRLPVGGRLSPSAVARGGRSCRATWRKASKRKSRTPPPRVAAWTRVVARMCWVVPEVRRYSTSWSPSPRRCCRTAAGLCRA